MENVRVDRTLQFGLNVTVKLGGGFGRSDVVVIAKPARAVALLLGDHDSLHASTDPLGDSIVFPDLVDPSLSWSVRTTFPLVVGWSTWQCRALCARTSCCSLAT